MVSDSEAFGRSRLVSEGVQLPSHVKIMSPGLFGLVHFIENGYLAEPGGLVRNFGAVVMTAFEQLMVTVLSTGDAAEKGEARTLLGRAGTRVNTIIPLTHAINRRIPS
jgi:hypothetical protein